MSIYLGYACLNTDVEPGGTKTFRLASYSKERLIETVSQNLTYLKNMLEYNKAHDIQFFRISSDIVPFASHEVCVFDWKNHFAQDFKQIGDFIKKHKMRVSFHPDQFVLLNSPSLDIFHKSVKELEYHVSMLELMGLNATHKVQIHVGGVYGDKELSINRFAERFALLPKNIQERLVIENDDRLYSLKDCLEISKKTGVPILFDTFHHECLNNSESMEEALRSATKTWKKKDGTPIIDYSSQDETKRMGAHTPSIDEQKFKQILPILQKFDLNVMLEIKDKQKSILKAQKIVQDFTQ